MKKRASFQVFTYQIYVVQQPGFILNEEIAKYYDLDPRDPSSAAQKKNKLFHDAIWNASEFKHRGHPVVKTNEAEKGSTFLLKAGTRKKTVLSNKKLRDEEHEHFPHVLVYFDNDPKVQVMMVQENTVAFYSPKTVARMIQDNVNTAINEYNLECVILPQFDENDFWKFVEQHPNKIVRVQFELTAPNLPRISSTIPEEINEIQRDTGSQSAKLELKSLPSGTLSLEKSNPGVANLARATAGGGGNIKLKIKNFKGWKMMSKTVREVSIDQFDAEGKPEDVITARFMSC